MSVEDELAATSELEELQKALVHTQRQLGRAKAKTDDLVDACYRAVKDAIAVERAFPPTPKPERDTRRKNDEPALWHVTGLQGGKMTEGYNRDVMRGSLIQDAAKAKGITEIKRTDH